MSDNKQPSMRDLDDAFLQRDIENLEKSRKDRNNFIGAIILSAIYILASTLFFGIFGYRGGDPEIGTTGILLDTLVIGFIVYSASPESDKLIPTIFGTIVFLCVDIFLKNAFLYPLITSIFS